MFFASSEPYGTDRLVRVVTRAHKKRAARMLALMFLVRRLSRSTLTHVAVSVGQTTISPDKDGDRLWPTLQFIHDYPRLTCVVDVPLVRATSYTPRHKPRLWAPSLIRWATHGLTPADDCVQATIRILRSGGAMIPDRITTPAELLDHFIRKGYRVRTF